MSALLSKLIRISDKATLLDAVSFWVVVAFVLGFMFSAEVATIAIMVVRAG